MKQLKDYVDSFNLITTKVADGADGGDSCAHGSAMMYAATIDPNLMMRLVDATNNPQIFSQYLDSLELQPGRYVRHPDKSRWYSHLDRLSRDQMTPLLALLGLRDDKPRLKRLFHAHLMRGLLFAWNTRRNYVYPTKAEHYAKATPDIPWNYSWKLPDLTGPEIWAMWIRALRVYSLYPLLLVLDLYTLAGSVQRRYFKTDNIQMNHVVVSDFSTRVMPTPVSLLARLIYGRKVAREALNSMWGDVQDNPPVNEFLIPILNKWKGRE